MITATLSLNLARKHSGMVLLRSSRAGHNSSGLSLVSSIITHFRKMRETVEQWMEKQYARSCIDELSVSLIRVSISSWNAVSFDSADVSFGATNTYSALRISTLGRPAVYNWTKLLLASVASAVNWCVPFMSSSSFFIFSLASISSSWNSRIWRLVSSVYTPAVLTDTAAVHSVSVCLSCSSIASSWDWQWLSWFFCCRLFSLSYLSTLAVALDAWDCSSSAGEGLPLERCCVSSQSGCISSSSQCLKFRPLVCIFIGHIRPLAEVIKPSRPLVASQLPKFSRIFGHYLCAREKLSLY